MGDALPWGRSFSWLPRRVELSFLLILFWSFAQGDRWCNSWHLSTGFTVDLILPQSSCLTFTLADSRAENTILWIWKLGLRAPRSSRFCLRSHNCVHVLILSRSLGIRENLSERHSLGKVGQFHTRKEENQVGKHLLCTEAWSLSQIELLSRLRIMDCY